MTDEEVKEVPLTCPNCQSISWKTETRKRVCSDCGGIPPYCNNCFHKGYKRVNVLVCTSCGTEQ